MFEKFSMSDIDSAGRGGEYTVQAGFGWTNGVVLWIASLYGDQLVAPVCPNLTAEVVTTSSSTNSNAAATLGLPSVLSLVGVVVVSVLGLFL